MPKSPEFIYVDGLRIACNAIEDIVRASTKFQPEKNDVVVAAFPKCGNTWTQQIVSMILRRGRPHGNTVEYFLDVPYVEYKHLDQLDLLPRPRCLKMHLPFQLTRFSEEARYVCVVRHPADTLVSLYHHTKFFPCYRYDGDLDDYFELFLKGEVDYNDYFDHVLSWYEQRNRPNVLYLTYEGMKEDQRGSVLKIARHIGEDHYKDLLENDEEVLKKVLYYSSFEYMKGDVNVFWREAFIDPPPEIWQVDLVTKRNHDLLQQAYKDGYHSVGQFMRKGVTGDGKATLSEEQKTRLNQRIREKLGHTDLPNLWEGLI